MMPQPIPCPHCHAAMVPRYGRFGAFLGCSRFPECRGTRETPLGDRRRPIWMGEEWTGPPATETEDGWPDADEDRLAEEAWGEDDEDAADDAAEETIRQAMLAAPPADEEEEKSMPAGERIFFQQGDVLVTNSRVVIGTNTYPMANVSSVKLGKDLEGAATKSSIGFVAPLVLGVVLSCSAGSWVPAALGGAAGVGLWIYFMATQQAVVVLGTSGGDIAALKSPDKELILKVLAAVNDAIVARG